MKKIQVSMEKSTFFFFVLEKRKTFLKGAKALWDTSMLGKPAQL